MKTLFVSVVLFLGALVRLYGQTTVDLRRQARNIDFSSATATTPWKTSTDVPQGCVPGQAIFRTQPPAGVYVCTGNNQWNPISTGGASGASLAAQLSDLKVEHTSAQVLTIGSQCSSATPCNFRFGEVVSGLTGSATATLSAGSGNAYVYLDDAGTLTIGHNDLTLSGSGIVVASAITAFPANSIPIWTWTATSGAWDSSGADKRAFLSGAHLKAGAGIAILNSPVDGSHTVAVDSASVGLRVTAPANATDPCTAGNWALDANYAYFCVAANSWKRLAISTW